MNKNLSEKRRPEMRAMEAQFLNNSPVWHVLDVGSVWMKEFASALSQFARAKSWTPDISSVGAFVNREREESWRQPPLEITHFPLQRGYSRFPFSLLADLGRRQSRRLLTHSTDPKCSTLICTTPYYAPVAERWPGPVVYYQTDLTYGYHGLKPRQVLSLDTRLCRVATAVCPNSQRIGHYMVSKAACDPAKILVVPNATREENILKTSPRGPGPLPEDMQDLPRPILGVIGNLAANLDWLFLEAAIKRTPDYSWVFVGPYGMEVHDADHREARARVLAQAGRRVRFVGSKSYGELQRYARTVDVAILPYRRKEPTFSGSSTRFYEHLAASRPILATHGFEELLHKRPLLDLVVDAHELAAKLEDLRAVRFEDGWEGERWEASKNGTWAVRAVTLMRGVQERWPLPLATNLASLPSVEEMLLAGRFHTDHSQAFELVAPN